MTKKFFILCLSLFISCVSAQGASSEEVEKDTIVVLETNEGDITLKLYTRVAPKASENFVGLIKAGYYDGVIFHRVIKDFMIQGGDPTGTGAGGESMWKKPFEDEVSTYVPFDRAGLLAMANAGKGTNGSQFFITTVPTPWLNGRHTIFGEVIVGMDTVRKIERTPTSDSRPKSNIYIIKAHLK